MFKKTNLKTICFACLLFISLTLLFVYLFNKSADKNQTKTPKTAPSFSPSSGFDINKQTLPKEDFARLDKEIKTEIVDPPSIGNDLKNTYKKMPWLEKLPIRKKSFVLIYDWEEKAVRARIIVDALSPAAYETQVEEIKKNIVLELQTIGVDLNKVPVYYVYTP
jgi:hypothetical protein